MKNFKLLLATTAILSVTSITANADGLPGVSDSTEFKAKAEIIKNLSLSVDQHLDFGRIAWDYSNKSQVSVDLEANSDGSFTPYYTGVKFHDGAKVAKICFTDIVPTAELGNGLTITDDINGPIYDDNENQIGFIDMGAGPWVDAGASDGIRCAYKGGELDFSLGETASQNFSGKIEKTGTVTVMFADD